jgi:hypothetical protein
MTNSVFPKHPKKTSAPPIVSRVWHANNSQEKTKNITSANDGASHEEMKMKIFKEVA